MKPGHEPLKAGRCRHADPGDWGARSQGFWRPQSRGTGCMEPGDWSTHTWGPWDAQSWGFGALKFGGLGCMELGHGEAGGLSHLWGEEKAAGVSPAETQAISQGKTWLIIYPHQLPRGTSNPTPCSVEDAAGAWGGPPNSWELRCWKRKPMRVPHLEEQDLRCTRHLGSLPLASIMQRDRSFLGKTISPPCGICFSGGAARLGSRGTLP